MTTENPSQLHRFGTVEILILLIVVLAAALAMSPNVADPDLWGHVQYGRDVLETGTIAETTSYSFTADGYRWINHENLSEIVMAMVADTLGPIGLVAGKILLSFFVIGLVLWWNLKRGVGLIATCILVLLLGANLGYHWSIRPQLSSFVGFAVMVAILQFCFEGWRGRWHLRLPRHWFEASETDSPNELGYHSIRMRFLWVLPFVFLIWANSHGGFIAGLCVYCAYLGFRAIESISRRGIAGSGIARRMALMGFVAVLATLLNPYGPRLHLWLLESLGNPRPEISDWAANELTSVVGLKLWALVAVVVFSLALSRQRKDATQLILLALTLWQSVSHFRHVPFFAILVAFWMGPHLQSTLERLKISVSSQSNSSGLVRASIHAVLVLAIGLVGYRLFDRATELPVKRDVFPVDAVRFMQQHNMQGRMVVTYDWAQYAIAAFCVDRGQKKISRVAFDGRFRTCYPQEVVDMHFDFLFGHEPKVKRFRSPKSPPLNPVTVLQHGKPTIVLISRHGEFTEKHMQQQSDDWVLLYQDGLAQVWGAKERFDRKDSPDYISPEQRVLRTKIPQGFVRWPAY